MRGQRSSTMEGALDFWSEQLEMEEGILSDIEDKHSIRYEDLLSDPKEALSKLHEYLSIEADPQTISSIEDMIDPTRAFAYRTDPELTEFSSSNSDVLARHGYSA
tara:strand:- start:1085 stop:1399 length:315 start_codon:yes stop_codon:yes gene_type:complete